MSNLDKVGWFLKFDQVLGIAEGRVNEVTVVNESIKFLHIIIGQVCSRCFSIPSNDVEISPKNPSRKTFIF